MPAINRPPFTAGGDINFIKRAPLAHIGSAAPRGYFPIIPRLPDKRRDAGAR